MKNEVLFTGNKELENLELFKLGDLIALCSRPAVGKSTISQKLLVQIVNNNKVGAILFNMELSKDKIKDKMSEFTQDIDNLNIVIDDTPAVTVQYIIDKIKELKSSYNLKFVVIDYLQLIKDSNSIIRIANILDSLKKAAQELNISIMILTQLSRDDALTDIENSTLEFNIDANFDSLLVLNEKESEQRKLFVIKAIDGKQNIYQVEI